MEEVDDSARPTKRARFDEALHMPGTPIDDTADLYGTPSAKLTPASAMDSSSGYVDSTSAHPTASSDARPVFAGIPGLGMLSSATTVHQGPDPTEKEQKSAVEPADHPMHDESSGLESLKENAAESSDSHVLIDQHMPDQTEGAASVILEPSLSTAPAPVQDDHDATSALFAALGSANSKVDSSSKVVEDKPADKPADDPEFIEAGQANKDNPEAEWELDSSAEESSSDDSSEDLSSDEDDEDDEGLLLDPATMAKMLMSEERGEDDDGAPHSNNFQLRTKNEQVVVDVPKPDITVTPDMKVTPLGSVEHIVDNMILIKAHTSGEYQVLEQGSALCLENREVIGAVAETIGRVQAPLYSVAFTTAANIKGLGISQGTTIFYVDAHSTFVFTQPLKAMKGTDASNLHDEEIAEDEMEFSDDEAEAAYKRAKKEAKKGGRQARLDGNAAPPPPTAQPYIGGAINYDDEDGEEVYTPLARPDNLQQAGMPTLEERSRRTFTDRGRGRGAGGRGRGDRGRGDRGRGRGGRGGGNDSNQRRGPSKSFPDSHNTQMPNYAPQPLPPKPVSSQAWLGQQAPPLAFPHTTQHQQYPQTQQAPPQAPYQQSFPSQAFSWPQIPNPQQFQQLFSNFNAQQQVQYPPAPPTPGGSIPAGAFVNPAFFHNQQQQQQYPQQTPVQQSPAQIPSADAFQAAQDILRRLNNNQ
ncbi:hypothetical protein MBLNU459_g2705t1 [Dothideomycetes sp. NU459]